MHKANLIRILYFLFFCSTAAWLPLISKFCAARGLSGTQTSLVLSISAIMMFAVQPLYGMLSDKIGYKRTLLISSLLASVSYLGYLYDAGYGWLLFVTAFMSLFYNAIQPLLDSISLQLGRENPNFSYGSLRIAGAAGWAMTGIVTGFAIDDISINVIFVVSAVTMFLVFIAANFLEGKDDEKNTSPENPFRYFTKVIGNRSLLFLLLCVFLVSTCATTIWYYYSIYMDEIGASSGLTGFGLSFQGLCELPLFYFSAAIILRIGLKTTLVITIFATALRLLLYHVIKNPIAAIPIELLHGLSWSLFWVACVESVNKLVDPKWMVTGQSMLYVAYFGAGMIAGNYLTGYLHDNKWSIAEIFLLDAVIVTAVAILLAVFMKKNAK
jgi:MFS transporter, PPP family, 3-phenylpropionic acid transporter